MTQPHLPGRQALPRSTGKGGFLYRPHFPKCLATTLGSTVARPHAPAGSGRVQRTRKTVNAMVAVEGPAAVLSRGQYLRDINCAHNRVRHSGLIRMKLSVIFNTIQDQ